MTIKSQIIKDKIINILNMEQLTLLRLIKKVRIDYIRIKIEDLKLSYTHMGLKYQIIVEIRIQLEVATIS